MGCDLPKIHIEWDEAHAAGLQPELRTYREIVIRLGSHEGVETSLEAAAGEDERLAACDRGSADETEEKAREEERPSTVLHDVRAMCRSLGRMRDLGATVMIDGRVANAAALDAYEATLARELREPGSSGAKSRRGSPSLLSSIIYLVSLAVILQWLLSSR